MYYTGIINLSRIPKDLIRENRNGDKIVYADFSERRTPSQYGDTHYLKLYDSTNRQQIYIGDFRPSNFTKTADNRESAFPPAPAAPAAPPAPADDDLPDFLK